MSTLNQVITELQTAKENIGQAIAAKGGTVLLNDGFSDYAADIATIPTGAEKKDVNFYDYDGTLVKSYTIAEAQALTALPTAPSHDELTFQEWNYTLAEFLATTAPIDSGATYITIDGKTWLFITLTTVSGLTPPLYFNKSDTSELTIDWGDGNAEINTSSGNLNTSHTYSTVGNYIIKMWISSGSGTYGFGNGVGGTVVVGGEVSAYQETLTKCYVGANVVAIGNYAFTSCHSLTLITLPNSILSIGNNVFQACHSLLAICIPIGVTVIGTSLFNACRSLSIASLPDSITTINVNAFSPCYTLKTIRFSSNMTSIGASAFQNDTRLMVIVCASSSPPTLSTTVFANITSICHIRVPSASLSAYQTATNWAVYANYMEGY